MTGVYLVGNFRFMCYLPMSSLAAIKTKETVEPRLAFLAFFWPSQNVNTHSMLRKLK